MKMILFHILVNVQVTFRQPNHAASMVLCHFAKTASSSVFSPTMTMSLQCGEYAQSEHVDGACWRILDVYEKALDSSKGVSLSLS